MFAVTQFFNESAYVLVHENGAHLCYLYRECNYLTFINTLIKKFRTIYKPNAEMIRHRKEVNMFQGTVAVFIVELSCFVK